MLKQILAITIKDIKVLLKDRGGMVSLFLMPVMFILFMSSASEGAYEISDEKPIKILVVNLDDGDLAGEAIGEMEEIDGFALIENYDGKALTLDSADQLIANGEYQIALVFPTEFSKSVLDAATDQNAPLAIVTFIVDPAAGEQLLSPVRATVQGYVQKLSAYAQVPLQMEAGFEELAAGVPAEQAPLVTMIGKEFIDGIESSSEVGGETNFGVAFEQTVPKDYSVEEFPSPIEQNVPGYTIFGVFFIVQVLAGSILQEKEEGTFRRLMVAPLPRAALLLGKLLPYYLVNLIQVASMFAIGVFMFEMGLGVHPLGLIVVTLATAAAATGLEMLIAALGRTREQIGGISTLLVLTLAAVGGMMIPTFVMPEFMQQLAKISPHYWALSGYQDIIVRGLEVTAVFNEVGILLGFAAAFFTIALLRFRFE